MGRLSGWRGDRARGLSRTGVMLGAAVLGLAALLAIAWRDEPGPALPIGDTGAEPGGAGPTPPASGVLDPATDRARAVATAPPATTARAGSAGAHDERPPIEPPQPRWTPGPEDLDAAVLSNEEWSRVAADEPLARACRGGGSGILLWLEPFDAAVPEATDATRRALVAAAGGWVIRATIGMRRVWEARRRDEVAWAEQNHARVWKEFVFGEAAGLRADFARTHLTPDQHQRWEAAVRKPYER